jgi:hypothetical protein
MAPSGGGGGGGGGSGGGLGQGIGDILSGGLSAALGIQGLTGTNYNQLQAGAAAANPFGSQANQYYSALQQMLLGGINQSSANNFNATSNFLSQILPQQTIGTNLGSLTQAANTGTPTQTSQLQQLTNNPTQLISTLQGGGVQLPSSIQSILNQNPYQLTSGQQFQEQQGLDSLNRSLASTGQVGSGNQFAAAEQYGQNFASQAVQQNISNLLGAQQSANQTSSTNQGLQSIINSMGQNQFGNTLNLAQLLTGQNQQNFSNLLGAQQLQSSQQQNTGQNLQNILQLMMGIGQNYTGNQLQQLNPLLTATQASTSSPATAGGILSNLGVANQASGQNVASGLGGIANGVGNLIQGINFGSGGATGSFSGGNFGGAFVNPTAGYTGGGNSYGFTMS